MERCLKRSLFFSRLLSLFIISLLIRVEKVSAQAKCGFDKIYKEVSSSPEFIKQQEELFKMAKTISKEKAQLIITIPTVVHVIYKNQVENISDDQILSQLEVLNKDFRKKNPDTSLVDAGFSIADVGFEFCLAQRDPNGNLSTGITRTETTIDDVCSNLSSSYYQLVPAWDPKQYLNIWVCDAGDRLAGFAFPPFSVPSYRDGVVINYNNFGTEGAALAPYDGGRTATHEVGHWFNLLHIWGNADGTSANCNDDDNIADTPVQKGEYLDCPGSKFSCGSKDMVTNFMGYVDDYCMSNFTDGQRTVMRSVAMNARGSLRNSPGCIPGSVDTIPPLNTSQIVPNPSVGYFIIDLPLGIVSSEVTVELFSAQGKKVRVQTKEDFKGLRVDTFYLEDAIYICRISYQGEQTVKKVIVTS
jgi:hypothetical protein